MPAADITHIIAPNEPTLETIHALLSNVWPNPWQTRQHEDPAHVAEIADKIRASKDAGVGYLGLWQPLLARRKLTGPDGFEIAFGMTRLSAYKLVNPQADAIPLIVAELSDQQMSDLAAQENAQRKDLSAIETAMAIQRRIDDFGMNQMAAAEPFGYKNQASVSNLLRLLKLPENIRADVDAGRLPERLARQLVSIAEVKGVAKEVEALAKAVGDTPPSEREEFLQEGLRQIAEEKGRAIVYLWPLGWPDAPIPTADPDLSIPACTSCEFLFRRRQGDFCLRPSCFDKKRQIFIAQLLAARSASVHLPVAQPGEKTVPVDTDYSNQAQVLAVIKLQQTGKGDYGLRLMELPSRRGMSWEIAKLLDSRAITIGTVKPDAVAAEIKALKDKAEKKTSKAAPAKSHAPKSSEDAYAEREAADARRAERSVALRLEADLKWLVINATSELAQGLTISGYALRYVLYRLIRNSDGPFQNVYGLLDWYEALRKQAGAKDKTTKTKADKAEADMLYRKQLAASQIAYYCLQSQHPEWARVRDEIADLALGELDDFHKFGLGVELPDGWDEPPIHTTPYNCWHCGEFTANRRMSKGDLERGWKVIGDEVVPTDVLCPTCAAKPMKTSKPAKKSKR